jgi:hypothetical protein
MKYNNVAFVTCIYDGYHGTIFGGRPNRKKHYIESLKSISGTECMIYCFTAKSLFNELSKEFANYKNITLIEKELTEFWFSDYILSLKNKSPELYVSPYFWNQRNCHIMWGKTEMLKSIMIENNHDYIFWIDAGLSSDQLFPHEYFPEQNRDKSTRLFTKTLIDNVIIYIDNKILALNHTSPNNPPLPEKYYTEKHNRKRDAMVGGFFGGKSILMREFVQLATNYMNTIIQHNELYGEEGIYSTISHERPELFNITMFDTFYHRNWGTRYNKTMRVFSDFFEKVKYIENKSNITYVTALYDLGRGEINDSFKRSFEHYKECFAKLLKIKHINLVVFCDSSLNEFINSHRTENIKIYNKSLEDIKKNFAFYDKVQDIRKSDKWLNQVGWLKESTQATLPDYNPLVMSKHFLLNDATIFNHFNNEYFCWIDAGLANTVNLDSYFSVNNYHNFEKKMKKKLNKMLYLCFPYDGKVEVHGFTKNGMNKWAGTDTQHVARGGFFGGNKHTINKINEIYYQLLNETLNVGEMGTEESIFTLITYRHPELTNIHMIEENGLVYKFFQDLYDEEVAKSSATELAIYSLVYNTPDQFEMWLESFKRSYPEDFIKHKKYVINNSTEQKHIDRYNELFKQYDFEVIHEGKNVGIQDGRQLCAMHFDNSDHDYYIFFEEDFLFVDPKDPVQIKDGFMRYIPRLFDKSIDILKNNDLDYLRLTIIEFFGNNIYDWSYKNLPKNKKDEFFPVRSDGNEDLRWKSKVDYLGIYDNVAYAIGHFHYSNWPLLFCKRGNKQVFLDIVYEHLYEQTVMSQAKMFMMDGKLKVGTIMGAPVYHERKVHYNGKTRRENRHYTN